MTSTVGTVAKTAATYVTQSMTTAIVPSLKETSGTIYRLLSGLYTYKNEVAISLKSMDLEARVKVIKALVIDLESLPSLNSLSVACVLLNETMSELLMQLQTLATINHKYSHTLFGSWLYDTALQNKGDDIYRLNDVLEKRLQMVIKILPLAFNRNSL